MAQIETRAAKVSFLMILKEGKNNENKAKFHGGVKVFLSEAEKTIKKHPSFYRDIRE